MKDLKCKFCGCSLTEETAKKLDGEVMCLDCFEEKTTTCECCGERIWEQDCMGNENIRICGHCYDYNYCTCESCGRLIHNDDAYYYDDSDYPYCHECYNKLDESSIRSYNYKPEPIFYGSGDLLYMGVELEIDKGGEDERNAEILLDIGNRNEPHIYCKHDGSLNEGFEIVSHPMTHAYHTKEMNWKEILDKAIALGYRSHQTSTCGLHVHVSRSAFGKTQEEQEDVISRVVYLVEHYWNELLRFSRRTEANIERWASRYGISTTTKETYELAKKNRLGRYVAVNLENENTVEFRTFRGTLCYKTFIATLQLVYELCRFAIMLSDKELEKMPWSEFVLKLDPFKKELIECIKSKRLYVNEIIDESEEM